MSLSFILSLRHTLYLSLLVTHHQDRKVAVRWSRTTLKTHGYRKIYGTVGVATPIAGIDSKDTEAQTMMCKNAKQAWIREKKFQFTVLHTKIVKLKIKQRTRAHRQGDTDEKSRLCLPQSKKTKWKLVNVRSRLQNNNRHKASKATDASKQSD